MGEVCRHDESETRRLNIHLSDPKPVEGQVFTFDTVAPTLDNWSARDLRC
ncbi:hypothetical protein RND71_001605 [Anisodus tanguticus]|uniref:Uncharacterized protein n=1 Tax=Anisodus tanguticus TaxID=243964 RepID=A0AAE1T1Q2_9SOLA|nr:hypothetical protein RND71_001605 [Anisodus tanguticus]